MEFIINGTVREKESKRPIPGLLVRAFDKDLLYSDLLGNAITSEHGTFSIGYKGKDFQELFDKRPDIYLDIYNSGAVADQGRPRVNPIYTSKQNVRFNAGWSEYFEIEIPREQLGGDAPGTEIIPIPEPGKWKDLIDEYFNRHPIDFQFDPDKHFAAPHLDCTSNFGPEIRYLSVGDSAVVTVTVTNKGNGVSFSSYVEVYEGPWGYSHPLRDYRLCDYQVITINPGQTVDVKLQWNRLLETGRIVGVCFDPFMDPRGFHLVEQYNDHITSIHYQN